jgi:hypothetical protein
MSQRGIGPAAKRDGLNACGPRPGKSRLINGQSICQICLRTFGVDSQLAKRYIYSQGLNPVSR